MSVLDMVISLDSKTHYCDEIDRKMREIGDLRTLIELNYKKITEEGVLEGTAEGDMLIDDIDDILNKIDYMTSSCINAKNTINSY